MIHEITVALGRHGWVLGAPRPDGPRPGPTARLRRAPEPRCRLLLV